MRIAFRISLSPTACVALAMVALTLIGVML